jgi:hypothetical protein
MIKLREEKFISRNTLNAHMYQSVRVTLQLTVNQSVLVLSPSWTDDQILAAVKTVAILFVVGRSSRREDGSVMYQVTALVCVGDIYLSTFFLLSLHLLGLAVQVLYADHAYTAQGYNHKLDN